MKKRVRYPKKQNNQKEEKKEEEKKHFVLEVHDGNLSNDSKVGK